MPTDLVKLVNDCCSLSPETRPLFWRIVETLEAIQQQLASSGGAPTPSPAASFSPTPGLSGASTSTSTSTSSSSSSRSDASALTSPSRSREVAFSANDKVTLWIDSNVSGANAALVKRVETENPHMHIMQFATLPNARTWIDEHKELVAQLIARGGLRIVTNSSRPGDGDDKAGKQTCEWIRRKFKSSVPVLMFCGSRDKAERFKDLHVPRSKVWVSSDADVAAAFMAAKKPYDALVGAAAPK